MGAHRPPLAPEPEARYAQTMLAKLIGLILHFLLSGLGVLLVAKILPGIEVKAFKNAVAFAVVLAIFNAIAWSFLAPLTYTFTALTLGFGFFVVQALVFLVAGNVVNGVRISGCITAGIASIALSVVNAAIHWVFGY